MRESSWRWQCSLGALHDGLITSVRRVSLKSGRPTPFTRSREKSHECELAARGFRLKGTIMKILHHLSGKLIMVAIACSLAASAPVQARVARSNSASARSKEDARLVVTRAANFGTFQFLILFVDGVQVADLGLGQSYDAVLPPGQHVLSVSTTPQIYRRVPPTQRRVNLEPGETYAFTGFWKNSYKAYLEKNGSSKRIITPSSPGGSD